jgi:hypothetical protein
VAGAGIGALGRGKGHKGEEQAGLDHCPSLFVLVVFMMLGLALLLFATECR